MIDPYTRPLTTGLSGDAGLWRHPVFFDDPLGGGIDEYDGLDSIAGGCFGARITFDPPQRTMGWSIFDLASDSVTLIDPQQEYLSLEAQSVYLSRPHAITWYSNVDGVIAEYGSASSIDHEGYYLGPSGQPFDHLVLSRQMLPGPPRSIDVDLHAHFQGWGQPDWSIPYPVGTVLADGPTDSNLTVTLTDDSLFIGAAPTWGPHTGHDFMFMSLVARLEADDWSLVIWRTNLYKDPLGGAGVSAPTQDGRTWRMDDLYQAARYAGHVGDNCVIRLYDQSPDADGQVAVLHLIGTITPAWPSKIEGQYFCPNPVHPFASFTMDHTVLFNFTMALDNQ